MLSWRLGIVWPLAALVCLAAANVEKAVFVATGGSSDDTSTAPSSWPALRPSLFRHLPRLAHDRPENAWRTYLPSVFAWSTDFPARATTWVRLDALRPGQRYEVRVCWAATQPTEFAVDVFASEMVAADPTLLAALATYDTNGANNTSNDKDNEEHLPTPHLVRIVATADYVSSDPARMPPSGAAPPVLVDVILDPFLGNVLPRSLVPTVAVVVCVAAVSAWLALRVIRPWLQSVATAPDNLAKKTR